MERRVLKKQYISDHCFVCGTENTMGLHAVFYELEGKEVAAIFDPPQEYQSYPQRLHGGISAAILDETLGRAILVEEPETWSVTAELTLRYLKPVPLDHPVKVLGRVTKNSKRLFQASGELLLPNGEVAVKAEGKFVKLRIDQIASEVDPAEASAFMQPCDCDMETLDL